MPTTRGKGKAAKVGRTQPSGLLLGLDLGTTNVKAAIADQRGRVYGLGSAPVAVSHVGQGGVEQDLDDIWRALLRAVREALRAAGAASVDAVGVSSQGGALQLLDRAGGPTGPVISWLDARGRPFDEALDRELGREWFRSRIGHDGSGLAIGQIQRLGRTLRARGPCPKRVGFVGDCILERLCGRAAHDATSAGLTLLYNPSLNTYDPELLARLGLDSNQLPDLTPPREPAGVLLPAAARRLGLPAGIPVGPALHDQYAAALGTGSVQVGDVMFGAGTAWVLLAVLDQLVPPLTADAFVCRHVVEGLYGQILSLRNGGSSLSWALRLIGRGSADVADVDRLLTAAPPGCAGLRFWPFLAGQGAAGLPGALQGRLEGIQLGHAGPAVVRAVVEGLAFELNRHLDFLRRAGVPLRRLVMCGAAAASRVTPRLVADVTGLPVARAGGGQGSVLGAAVQAAALLNPALPFPRLVTRMAPAPAWVRPGRDRTVYAELARQYLASLPSASHD